MDIRPPKKKQVTPGSVPQQVRTPQPSSQTTPAIATSEPQPTAPSQAVQPSQSVTQDNPRPKKRKRIWLWVLGAIVALIILAGAGAYAWYRIELRPVSSNSTNKVRVTINEGASPSSIEALLKSKNLIRSTLAFDIYLRFSGTRSELQAGLYSFSPSDSTPAIIDNMVNGKIDQFELTFLPGATVAEDKTALENSGYSTDEVNAAFSKRYDSPIFASKPATAGLEGYIYGDTYKFNSDATVEQILSTTFDEYNSVINSNDLVSGFQKQGLSLFQGITLASIVQREVSNPDDQGHVAQIFLKRLQIGMPLGSDVTYHYAAQILGVAPTPTLDSPYNTRIYPGLPPGPIATPGLSALKAVANPSPGNYLYFLSGDDGKTYYATTAQEHQANIANHCQIKCATP